MRYDPGSFIHIESARVADEKATAKKTNKGGSCEARRETHSWRAGSGVCCSGCVSFVDVWIGYRCRWGLCVVVLCCVLWPFVRLAGGRVRSELVLNFVHSNSEVRGLVDLLLRHLQYIALFEEFSIFAKIYREMDWCRFTLRRV